MGRGRVTDGDYVMHVWRSGLAAVAAVIGLLAMSIVATYAIAFTLLRNATAESARQEADIGQSPRTPEFLTPLLYNISLCQLLFNETAVGKTTTLAVINTGQVPVEVDSIVVNIHELIIYMNQDRIRLLPGEYFAAPLPGLDPANATIQVHTSRGGFFVGGYGVPWPESVIRVTDAGVCVEP